MWFSENEIICRWFHDSLLTNRENEMECIFHFVNVVDYAIEDSCTIRLCKQRAKTNN